MGISERNGFISYSLQENNKNLNYTISECAEDFLEEGMKFNLKERYDSREFSVIKSNFAVGIMDD